MSVSIGALWDALNDQRRLRSIRHGNAPQSTYDAALYELRTHGIAQLANPNCQRRFGELSSKQVGELIAALLRLQRRYPAITDALLLKLDDFR